MDRRGGKGELGEERQARFPLRWSRAWLPFVLIPLGLFALSPRECSLVEKVTAFVWARLSSTMAKSRWGRGARSN